MTEPIPQLIENMYNGVMIEAAKPKYEDDFEETIKNARFEKEHVIRDWGLFINQFRGDLMSIHHKSVVREKVATLNNWIKRKLSKRMRLSNWGRAVQDAFFKLSTFYEQLYDLFDKDPPDLPDEEDGLYKTPLRF